MRVEELAFSPDGELLAAAVDYNEVMVFNVGTGSTLWSSPDPDFVALEFRSYRSRLLLWTRCSPYFQFDARTGEQIVYDPDDADWPYDDPQPPRSRRIETTRKVVRVLDVATGAIIRTAEISEQDGGILRARLSPDGEHAAVIFCNHSGSGDRFPGVAGDRVAECAKDVDAVLACGRDVAADA